MIALSNLTTVIVVYLIAVAGWSAVARYNPWHTAGWIVWIIAFFVLEFTAIWSHGKRITLTMFLINLVPRWILAMGIGWASYHFLIAHQ